MDLNAAEKRIVCLVCYLRYLAHLSLYLVFGFCIILYHFQIVMHSNRRVFVCGLVCKTKKICVAYTPQTTHFLELISKLSLMVM